MLRLGPGTTARFLSPQGDERHHLRLESGKIEADVAPGRGGIFRISTPAGEVHVLGTRLRASVFFLSGAGFLDGFQPAVILCAGVTEGKIRLQNARGSLPLSAPGRGVSLPGEPPGAQEPSAGPGRILRAFSQTLQWSEGRWTVDPGSRAGALLAAAAFWGGDAPDDPTWTSLWPASDSRTRGALVLLAGLRSPEGIAVDVAKLLAAEPEGPARAALVQVAAALRTGVAKERSE